MTRKSGVFTFLVTVATFAVTLLLVELHVRQENRLKSIVADRNEEVRTLNINRFYSDIDGREIANPRITLNSGIEIVGSVIVRQLPDKTWQVKIKPDDGKVIGETSIRLGSDGVSRVETKTGDEVDSELTVIADVVTESATYFDLGPSPDNPGAIRS